MIPSMTNAISLTLMFTVFSYPAYMHTLGASRQRPIVFWVPASASAWAEAQQDSCSGGQAALLHRLQDEASGSVVLGFSETFEVVLVEERYSCLHLS
jgi:hypothetical protein